MSDAEGKPVQVKTRPVRVRVHVRNGAVVEGLAHVHAGAYQRRVSDVLNVSPPNFVPVTDATVEREGASESVATVLINTSDIVMIETGATGDTPPPFGGDTDMRGASL